MEGCKPVKTPMETGRGSYTDEPAPTEERPPSIPYQNLIGNFMYLVQGTHPDIAFATHFLSQYNTNFPITRWKMAKSVPRYLQGTKDAGITYRVCGEPVVGHCDASWNESGTGHSRNGYAVEGSRKLEIDQAASGRALDVRG
ncbi:uncharacterized protein LOC135386461 [Ornithodoros turicata]|uniref:uncharacterized protein LOC135386461 n=1 Tax=Ornithodoros turicata TaxID=34597 RepID=UPI0031389987